MEELLNKIPKVITVYAVWSSNSVIIDDIHLQIGPSQKVYNHSSSFAWGYRGSGPAQLALALLLLYWPPEIALVYHQELKDRCIARWPENSFLQTVELRAHMERIVGVGQQDLF